MDKNEIIQNLKKINEDKEYLKLHIFEYLDNKSITLKDRMEIYSKSKDFLKNDPFMMSFKDRELDKQLENYLSNYERYRNIKYSDFLQYLFDKLGLENVDKYSNELYSSACEEILEQKIYSFEFDW